MMPDAIFDLERRGVMQKIVNEVKPSVLLLNKTTVKKYGSVIHRRVFINQFSRLRDIAICQEDPNNLDDRVIEEQIGKLQRNNFRKRTQEEIDFAFQAYLQWMSPRFVYNSDQLNDEYVVDGAAALHNMNMQAHEREVLENPYQIFYNEHTPGGNCTTVATSFIFLLQYIGVHPNDLGLTQMGADYDAGIYVMGWHKDKIAEKLRLGIINDRYVKDFNAQYTSKTMQLVKGKNQVQATNLETPFPNHQYVRVSGTMWPYYDPRCGYRYLRRYGMFEFWDTKDSVLYRSGTNTKTADIIAHMSAPDVITHEPENPHDHYAVQTPDVCKSSVNSLLGRSEDTAWLYVEGDTDEHYGRPDTEVMLKSGNTRYLPKDIATVFGYFISHEGTQVLADQVRAALDDYEGRSRAIFRTPSKESKRAMAQLRPYVGGEVRNSKYYSKNVRTKQIVTNADLRRVIYRMLGVMEPGEDVQALKKDSTLFRTIVTKVNMPSFLL